MARTKNLKENPAKDSYCELRVYENIPLSMMMLQGWFNDQYQCFELFLQALKCAERSHLFTTDDRLESVKAKYKQMWDAGEFTEIATHGQGVHKLPGQLSYSWFSWWAACVSRAVADSGGLEALLESLGTVEAAHDRFKPWFYRTRKVRNLNAADAARILARYCHLQPEGRPLLARGSLRGAAILLNDEPPCKDRDTLEAEYADESKRLSLEEKASRYIRDCRNLSRFGIWNMEEGESWFCNEVHKVRYPERQPR